MRMIRDPHRKQHLTKYYKILDRVIRDFKHHGTTSDQELRKALARYNLEPGQVGTFSDYEACLETNQFPPYAIYNTMRGPPGEHWFCCYKGVKYDPLGKDKSRSAEQPDESENCGQRCIAYLIMCKRADVKKGVPLF